MGLRIGIGLGIPYSSGVRNAVSRLPAPTNVVVTPGTTTFDASWDAVVGADSYEYNIGAGWGNIGLDTSIAGFDITPGDYVFHIRAVQGAVPGYTSSTPFSIANGVFYAGSTTDYAGSTSIYAGSTAP